MITPNRTEANGRSRRILILSGLLLAGLACASLIFVGRGLAAKPRPIKEMHDVHRANEIPCGACHASAMTSTAGTDNLLPAMAACGECHDIADQGRCGECHTNVELPTEAVRHQTVAQRFPHEKHVKLGMTCETCHGEKGEPEIPSMAVCRTCHETASAQADCGTCHATLEPLKPASHQGDWLSGHAVEAQAGQAACADCHAEKDCQDCHSGDNVRPRVHALGFAFDHALAARGNALECAACHETASFCAPCHQDQQVLPLDHSRANWVLPQDGGRHAEEGELDLESCIACHDAGASPPTCADCHAKKEGR